MNVNVKNCNSSDTKEFVKVYSEAGFDQLIPYIRRPASRSTLDIYLSNVVTLVQTAGVIDYAISDHLPAYMCIHDFYFERKDDF